MKSGQASMAAVCGGLLLLAGLFWWQSGLGETSLPTESRTAGSQDPASEAGTLKGAGKLQPKDADSERERLANRPIEKASEPTHGSLLLSVVYGDDNSPAAGIGVVVQEVTGQGPRATPRRLTTNQEGSVRVARLRPGKIYMRTDRQAMNGKMAEITAGKETKFTLTLEKGVDLFGVVVDDVGMTVADAEVILTGWAGMEPHVATRSDEQGRFNLRQVPEKCNIAARAKDYAPSPLRTITAGAGAKVEVRIVLPGPGGAVRGRVVDPDGKGVGDVLVKIGPLKRDYAAITLRDGSRGMKVRAAETRTGAEGRFQIQGLAPGKTPVLARGKTFAPWVGSVNVVARMTTSLVIGLQPGVTCEGMVYDAEGKPAARIEINHGAYGAPERRNTRSAGDGSYRLEGLPTGEILVEARGKNRGNASVKLNGVPGQTLRWDARLSKGRQLEVLVLDQANNALEGVRVMAFGAFVKGRTSWHRYGSTNKEGKFLVVDCEEGLLHLELQKEEYGRVNRYDIDPTAGRYVVQMTYEGKPTARIVGSILDPDGKPVAAAQLTPVRRGDPNSRVYNATSEGKIDIKELRPGSYRLFVRAGNYPRWGTEEHELANGETWDVGIVQLVRGSCVQVHVTNAAELAKDTPTVFLSVRKHDGKWAANINTRQLPLRSTPIVPGRYVLTVGGPAIVPQKVPITVTEEQDTEVRIKIQVGAPRLLEFHLPEEIKRLEMTLVGDSFRCTRQLTRSWARPIRLRIGLPPGHYKLEASTKQGHKGQTEFDVPAAEAAALTSKTIRVALK